MRHEREPWDAPDGRGPRPRRDGQARATEKPPPRTRQRREEGFFVRTYFFLPWFFTASMAAFAASGSRYVPPGLSGLKSASSS